MKSKLVYIIIFSCFVLFVTCKQSKQQQVENHQETALSIYKTFKPYTRWWWFADKIKKEDVKFQLDQAKEHDFGGVEIAWVYPLTRKRFSKTDTVYTPRYEWLSKEWSDIVSYTKQYCDSIGLGCDFTFGTGWPFGDTYVTLENSTQVYGEKTNDYKNTYSVSWEHPRKGYILNHLSKTAFDAYSSKMGGALTDALKGSKSCLFCDSWEVETRRIWTDNFDKTFKERYQYDIIPYMDSLYSKPNSDVHYDYMKLVSELVINNFYIPFTQWADTHNSYSRSQCSGAPVDIITAYSTQDVPESEAMLYEPDFSQIVSSAACLSGKKLVTSETFTCTYGFPMRDKETGEVNYRHLKEEQVADLKLVCDALFANGVNHVIWHGMPFNPIGVDTISFYATCHVGTAGKLWSEIKAFNGYMEKIQSVIRNGKTYSDVAVYIPQEDAWKGQEMDNPNPDMPWAWGDYEMRNVKFPVVLEGYHPLWINEKFLTDAKLKDGILTIGDASFTSLYIDVEYIEYSALNTIMELAVNHFPICLIGNPKEPGKNKHDSYEGLVKKLKALQNVSDIFEDVIIKKPLVSGENLPDFICKEIDNEYYFFFANPKSKNLKLPINYGQSLSDKTIIRNININIEDKTFPVELKFEPYQSLLFKMDKKGKYVPIDIKYIPNTPATE